MACNGACDCPRPCPDCRSRLVPWLGLAVPQYAISQLGEDWLRARVEQHPVRVRFPAALPFAAPVRAADTSPTVTQAVPARAGAEGPATGSATDSTLASPEGKRRG